jgi:hypothetical protein
MESPKNGDMDLRKEKMKKTKGILTIRPLSCQHHNKIRLSLPKVQAISHL